MKQLLLTPGMGIGPEVTAAALRQMRPSRPLVLLGRDAAVAPWFPDAQRITRLSEHDPTRIGLLQPQTDEPPEVAAIRFAAESCLSGAAAGLVTGPINKRTLADQGFAFMGHTDFLGHLCGVGDPVMAFTGGALRVALVTHHMPLMQVGAALTMPVIQRTVRIAHAALRDDLGIAAPRIVVCGLNPHAGERGLLGQEELETIGPACDALRAEGLVVIGPVSAETAFLTAQQRGVDLVVAMYHDQGLAPLKSVDFGRSVNWTLGLPIVRTSVDHGTAEHLMGTGRAESASMVAALTLAEQVLSRR
ncbi:MAG: 4-hydroxythreonine-4-phosphate dehydrogenase PdxA [Myxococcota bacterium]|nr:4-hydroxythreonine-4-phosphate dehydrogenase PdxA [Myxococcota bacterium]